MTWPTVSDAVPTTSTALSDRSGTLTYLTLVISYACSARCAHCCLGAEPDRRARWMTPQQARAYIEPLVRAHPIGFMSLIGGEPLIEVDRALAIGRIARACGIPKVQIDTNASWCKDEATTARVLERIYREGLEIGAVNVDAFHQRYIPRERVLRCLHTAARLGHRRRAQVYYLESPVAANPYEAATRELVCWLHDEGYETYDGQVVLQGRATSLASAHGGPRFLPTEACSGVPAFRNDDFRCLDGIEVDVYGWAMVEHGICIGNLERESLNTIMDRYQADTHPIVGVLLRDGPLGLARIAAASGFRLRSEGYVSKCQLCQEVRRHLRFIYPDHLAPAECYRS